MGGGTGDCELGDSELKEVYSLEFLTTIDGEEFTRKQIGFSKEKFVVLNVHGSRCEHKEVQIGPDLYALFKEQALKGSYRSAKEFCAGLEKSPEKIY